MNSSIFMLFFALFISRFEPSVSDFAVELDATNFNSVLKETPAPYAIVEFYAHWSPACRNYKLQYEKVARLFNGPDASHPGIILMTRVDCGLTMNSKFCDKFSVKYYPMLLWGPSKKFVGSGWDPKQENSEIRTIGNSRTADVLLGWINKQLGSLEQSESVSTGSQRAILPVISGQDGEKPDVAVELNATNFDSVLKETPAPYAIVEFFAHWCPACRNYKPQYEKVARLFNGPDAGHPGIILMTRVDCGLTINSKFCEKFFVTHYPMLLWGPSKKFVGSGWHPKQENSEILSIGNGRTADVLLGWINKQLRISPPWALPLSAARSSVSFSSRPTGDSGGEPSSSSMPASKGVAHLIRSNPIFQLILKWAKFVI